MPSLEFHSHLHSRHIVFCILEKEVYDLRLSRQKHRLICTVQNTASSAVLQCAFLLHHHSIFICALSRTCMIRSARILHYRHDAVLVHLCSRDMGLSCCTSILDRQMFSCTPKQRRTSMICAATDAWHYQSCPAFSVHASLECRWQHGCSGNGATLVGDGVDDA